jgi:hypothetical protein
VTAGNIADVARLAGARELHASARVFDPGIGAEGPAGLARGHGRSDEAVVRALREALDAESSAGFVADRRRWFPRRWARASPPPRSRRSSKPAASRSR